MSTRNGTINSPKAHRSRRHVQDVWHFPPLCAQTHRVHNSQLGADSPSICTRDTRPRNCPRLPREAWLENLYRIRTNAKYESAESTAKQWTNFHPCIVHSISLDVLSEGGGGRKNAAKLSRANNVISNGIRAEKIRWRPFLRWGWKIRSAL